MVYYSQPYGKPSENYFVKEQRKKRDFTNLIPVKRVDFLPKSFVGDGILGYTYLFGDYMVLRDDLVDRKREVDVHESIHTDNEYETRVLTWWMMEEDVGKYQN